MSELIQNEVGTPATPASGKTTRWSSNDATPLDMFMDDSGAVRLSKTIFITTASADFTGTNVNTAQPIFNTTEDVITLPSSTSYLMEASIHIHTTGTTSHTLGILFGGTATLTSIGYQVTATNAATEVLGAGSTIWATVATIIVVSAALASATHHSITLTGIVRINAGGTFIPQYQWSAAPGVAGVTLKESYFKLTPIGSNTMKAIGPWA